jgi:hypothetical protein
MSRLRFWTCVVLVLGLVGASSSPSEARQRNRDRQTNRRPPAEARVPAALANAHRRNVEEAVQRLLDSGVLLPEQEYWTRLGLEKFMAAPRGAQGTVLSGWDGDSAALEPNQDLESRSPSATFSAVQPRPDDVIISVGHLTCFVGDGVLLNGRFVAIASWYNPFSGAGGTALACQLTRATGYFFFGLDPSNVEVPIKMLYACANNPPGHWVFLAGLTNFGVQLTIIDAYTGISRTYNNSAGSSFQPIIDQSTPFPCP